MSILYEPVTYIDFYRPSFEPTGPEIWVRVTHSDLYAVRSLISRASVMSSTWQESSDYFIWHVPDAIDMSNRGARN